MTTYAALVTWAHGLTITGVTQEWDHTAENPQTADFPAKYLRLPGGGTNLDSATTCSDSGKARSIEIVILVEPAGQGTPDQNFDATVTLMDAAETALDASKPFPITNYDISTGSVNAGGVDHWAIVISVSGEE